MLIRAARKAVTFEGRLDKARTVGNGENETWPRRAPRGGTKLPEQSLGGIIYVHRLATTRLGRERQRKVGQH